MPKVIDAEIVEETIAPTERREPLRRAVVVRVKQQPQSPQRGGPKFVRVLRAIGEILKEHEGEEVRPFLPR